MGSESSGFCRSMIFGKSKRRQMKNGSRLVRVASRERSCKQVRLTTSFQLREALVRLQELQLQEQRLHSCCKQELHSSERIRKHRKERHSLDPLHSRYRKERHSLEQRS